MLTISIYQRIGIECELRKLCFQRIPSSGPRNKTVLAASSARESVLVDNSDTQPWVKTVMEGNDSGINIIELVFGPLPDSLLGKVIRVADLASNIDIKKMRERSGKSSVDTFNDWIEAFNKSLTSDLQNFRMEVNPTYAGLPMKAISGTSGAPSRQVNLTVPISAFADKNKLKELTDGFRPFSHRGIEAIPEFVLNEIRKYTPPFSPNPKAIGTVGLAAYFITLYASRKQSLNSSSVDKYLFHVLPKVDLGAIFRTVFPSSNTEEKAQLRGYIGKLLTVVCSRMTACETSSRADVIKNSIELLMNQTFGIPNCVINPRPAGVLPVYTISGCNIPAIVVELRSGSLTLLNNILKGNQPIHIWKNP